MMCPALAQSRDCLTVHMWEVKLKTVGIMRMLEYDVRKFFSQHQFLSIALHAHYGECMWRNSVTWENVLVLLCHEIGICSSAKQLRTFCLWFAIGSHSLEN